MTTPDVLYTERWDSDTRMYGVPTDADVDRHIARRLS